MSKSIYLLCFAMAFSSSVLAEQWYVDGGAGLVTFDDSVDTLSPTNIYFRGGYIVNENFNLGIESSVTVAPDQIDGFSSVDFSVDVVTVYVRGGVPVSDKVWVYAQLGSSNTELTAESGGLSYAIDDTDTMLGFGAEIDVGNGSTYLALNYSIYNNNDGADVTAINLGIGARF